MNIDRFINKVRYSYLEFNREYYPNSLSEFDHYKIINEYENNFELRTTVFVLYDNIDKTFEISVRLGRYKFHNTVDCDNFIKNGKYDDELGYSIDKKYRNKIDVANFILSLYAKMERDQLNKPTFAHDYVSYDNWYRMNKIKSYSKKTNSKIETNLKSFLQLIDEQISLIKHKKYINKILSMDNKDLRIIVGGMENYDYYVNIFEKISEKKLGIILEDELGNNISRSPY